MAKVLGTSVGLGSEQDQGHGGPAEDMEPYLEAGGKPSKVEQGDQKCILQSRLRGQLETGLEVVGRGTSLLMLSDFAGKC